MSKAWILLNSNPGTAKSSPGGLTIELFFVTKTSSYLHRKSININNGNCGDRICTKTNVGGKVVGKCMEAKASVTEDDDYMTFWRNENMKGCRKNNGNCGTDSCVEVKTLIGDVSVRCDDVDYQTYSTFPSYRGSFTVVIFVPGFDF
ncbi:hypothetical protein HELRODRAFT_177769 [Helobdella robusta]|uniref:Uncharacterized protein n=1 Tax=Helobdella robusta TaxID=6412 RepID=T1FC82_HELRO|nr:hypothetical protein HELRODRAFT_177769 [Helobdella robusta]ESN97710.1 hypothetical protein HELRODRAFT_177769 [Helobdella robusta]